MKRTALIITILILVSLLFGCAPKLEEADPFTTPEAQGWLDIGHGANVRVIGLPDGTRCLVVIAIADGGSPAVSCDWARP